MSGTKVLVVDDEEALRDLLAEELESGGYEVESAADGGEAIEKVRGMCQQSDGFDAIVLDINMPNVNGFEVLRYVKQNAPKTKVIMVTAYADVGNAVESMRLGASDFIAKPYDLDEVLTSISRILGA